MKSCIFSQERDESEERFSTVAIQYFLSKLLLETPFLISFFHTFLHRKEHLHYLVIFWGSSGAFSRFSEIHVSHWGRTGQGGGEIYRTSVICCHVLCRHRGIPLWMCLWDLFFLIFNHQVVLFLPGILLFISGFCFHHYSLPL